MASPQCSPAYAQTASAATARGDERSTAGRKDFARAMSRLTRGEAPEDAIDDRLLAEYAIGRHAGKNAWRRRRSTPRPA